MPQISSGRHVRTQKKAIINMLESPELHATRAKNKNSSIAVIRRRKWLWKSTIFKVFFNAPELDRAAVRTLL